MSSKANSNESEENSSKSKDSLDRDWHSTEYDRVFYAQNLAFERGEIEDAKEYAERFDDWYIVVTCGPHRSHDISYTVRPDHNAIHLDYYSVRPRVGCVDDIGDDIQKGIDYLRKEGELDNEGDL